MRPGRSAQAVLLGLAALTVAVPSRATEPAAAPLPGVEQADEAPATAPAVAAEAGAAAALVQPRAVAMPLVDLPPGAIETALVPGDGPARMVLAYWPEAGWRVRQSGGQVELALPGAVLDIDPTAIPLPLGDGAVLSLAIEVSGGETRLHFGLGCDCTLAVQGDGTRLMIDVVGAERAAGPILHDPGPAPAVAPLPARRVGDRAVASADPLHPTEVEATRTRLLEELRRAAESGLVTLRADAPGLIAGASGGTEESLGLGAPSAAAPTGPSVARAAVPVSPVEAGHAVPTLADAPPPPEPAAEQAAAGQATADPAAGATVAEALLADPAREPEPDPAALVAASPAAECFDNAVFGLPDPMPADELVSQISLLRRNVVREFDRPDATSAFALARLYIAHGLGAEALGVLNAFVRDMPEARPLAAMAWLAEGRPQPQPNVLALDGCTGQHALWQAYDAALAGRDAEAVALEAKAVGALEQTARGLRGPVAVQLGMAAAARGALKAAYRLAAMARRSVDLRDDMARETLYLMEAALARASGESGDESVWLAKLEGVRSEAGETALLRRAELAIDENRIVSPAERERLRIDLGALAMTARDTEIGARAFLAEAELTGHMFGRDAAFELLEYGFASRVIDEDTYRDALSRISTALPEVAGDRPLALLYEADPARFATSLQDPGYRRALARSYLGLGAPALAEGVLQPGDLDGSRLTPEIARAHAETGDAAAARRLAAQLPEGPERTGIEARAALAEGDPVRALPGLIASGAEAPETARVAWAAGAWDAAASALAEAADPALSAPEEGGSANGRRALVLRLAAAAERAGDAALPELVRGLAAGDDALLSALEGFGPPSAELTPEAVPALVDRLGAERRLIEEILNDG